MRAGKDTEQVASAKNRFDQTKIKIRPMSKTFDTFQTPNGKSLNTNQQGKIQWLFWNEREGQCVFLQQVTSQKF